MINKNIIMNYLKEKNYNINTDSRGITITNDNNEIVITGNQLDLIELADYIVSVALSENKNDHLHLDDLTLVSKDSKIENLIIEKSN